jgi:starch synthase
MACDLPAALAAQGHELTVISIKPRLSPPWEQVMLKTGLTFSVPVSWRNHQAEIYKYSPASGIDGYFIYNQQLFDRDGLYGNAYGDYEDNSERFIFFSRAALELLISLGSPPDIIHANNWTTGLVPLYLRSLYRDIPLFKDSASLITVHNLSNQGIFWHYDMPLTSLGWEYFNPDSIEFYGNINLLKAGLVYADMISFPSPGYQRQAMTPEYGYGLEGVLRARKDHIGAVLGGVNPGRWSPANAAELAAPYSRRDMEGKSACARDLRERLGLPDSRRPLLAVIGRLGAKRGLEFLSESLGDIFALGLDVAVLGQMEHMAQAMLEDYQKFFPQRLGFSMDLTPPAVQRFLAGSDMLLVYSPVAGEQHLHMCAQLYGTAPVALDAGVMTDSIVEHTPDHPGTGFLFARPDKTSMLAALAQAVACRNIPEQWQGVMRRGMEQDFSWAEAARNYEELYRQAIIRHKEI